MAILSVGGRLVTRATIEERMMQQSKKKLVLEHLVVRKMSSRGDLKQEELDDILRYGAQELFMEGHKEGHKEEGEKEQQDSLRVIDLEAARAGMCGWCVVVMPDFCA